MEENRLLGGTKWRALRYLLPSPGSVLFTLLIVSFAFWVQNVRSSPTSVPARGITESPLLPYQGRLADADGTSLNGLYDLTFQLYDVDSGGNALWTEAWTDVAVDNGLFNVLLGSTIPISSTIITNNSNLWLGVTVEGDEMTPRIQLGAAPFAVQAFRVEQADVVSNVESVQGDTELSVGATGYIDLLEIPVAVEEAATLRITFHSLIWKTVAPGRIALGVRIDGNANTSPEPPSVASEGESPSSGWTTQSAHLANTYYHEVTPGQHTVTLVLGSWDGGFAHARAYALNVEILKQP